MVVLERIFIHNQGQSGFLGKILKLLKENDRLTIAEIVKQTGANQNTLKVRLRELVNEGRVKRHGKARATWYSA